MAVIAALLVPANAIVRGAAPIGPGSLAGTAWQLVQIQGSDDRVVTPETRSNYTVTFKAGGEVSVRIDCNWGRGTWKSPGPNQLLLGPLAITRATCAPGSLHDRILKDWNYVRSFVIKDGHLFLSLMADGGVYEFEPVTGASALGTSGAGTTVTTPTMPVKASGPFTLQCRQSGGGAETLTVTFYQTEPALALVERAGQTRPAFRVVSASGAKYEGEGLTVWDAAAEVTVTWLLVKLTCTRG
jgi:heat shock protein HslJ/membrane-bound inhibitor of C-type lysozyme